MNLSRILLFIGVCLGGLAHAEEWKRWPKDADEFSTTIGVPPGFTLLRWRPAAATQLKGDAPNLLSARFRSPDGNAEFTVIVFHTRRLPNDADARRITMPLARGEKKTGGKVNRKKAEGEQGLYWLHDEESTIEGPGYTRYQLNSFSTSSLPGAASVFWEFQVADEAARKRYAPLWRRFKDSLEVEED